MVGCLILSTESYFRIGLLILLLFWSIIVLFQMINILFYTNICFKNYDVGRYCRIEVAFFISNELPIFFSSNLKLNLKSSPTDCVKCHSLLKLGSSLRVFICWLAKLPFKNVTCLVFCFWSNYFGYWVLDNTSVQS